MADDSSGLLGNTGLTGAQAGALGTGALALGGLSYLASQGPTQVSSIPGFQQANLQVPLLQQRSAMNFSQGQGFINQAQAAYDMAQRGQLTPEQAAENQLKTTAETNQATQMYRSMGRDPTQDTSWISTQQQIDLNATARAQEFIRSTIALATSQAGVGTNLIGAADTEMNAATGILLEEGKQQVALNKQFSDSMASAFKAFGSIAGGVIGGMFGGPAGAMVGSSLGGLAAGQLASGGNTAEGNAVYQNGQLVPASQYQGAG